jgi:type II secretory ATPase GspE/PulE/Tfp pilus assembly ATPase PilB-like protein
MNSHSSTSPTIDGEKLVMRVLAVAQILAKSKLHRKSAAKTQCENAEKRRISKNALS